MRLQNRRLRVQISPALQGKSPTGDWDVGESVSVGFAPELHLSAGLRGFSMGKESGGCPISASPPLGVIRGALQGLSHGVCKWVGSTRSTRLEVGTAPTPLSLSTTASSYMRTRATTTPMVDRIPATAGRPSFLRMQDRRSPEASRSTELAGAKWVRKGRSVLSLLQRRQRKLAFQREHERHDSMWSGRTDSL